MRVPMVTISIRIPKAQYEAIKAACRPDDRPPTTPTALARWLLTRWLVTHHRGETELPDTAAYRRLS